MKKKLPIKKSPQTSSSSPPKPAAVGVMKNPFSVTKTSVYPGGFIMLYGPPGEGKTTVAAHAPKPLFTHTSDEQGIKFALSKKVVPADLSEWLVELDPLFPTGEIPEKVGHPGWIKLINTMRLFAKGEHDRRTLVIDSLSGLEALTLQHCASVLFKGDMVSQDGFMNFYAGHRKTAEEFWRQEFMVLASSIVAKGYNIILLAHSTLQNIPNPSGQDYQIYSPDLDKRIWNETKKSLQGIFFMGRSQSLKKDDKRRTKVTAEHRFIGVSRDTWFEAKNWFNSSEPVEVGNTPKETWENLNRLIGLK